jgi:tetratricopeptide (TPR) repeat protein
VTCILPHGDPIHLLFNLYWLWEFGAVVERRWGSLRSAAVVLFFAAGSSAAEYAFVRGGIGLSGVGYGLFGLLWVLGRRSYEWDGVLQPRVIQVFVVWFFICIFVTAAGIQPIGNVAHGTGAALGALLGLVVTSRPGRRALYLAGITLLLAVIGVAATAARPLVNFSSRAHADLFRIAYDAFDRGDKQASARWYERAVRTRSGRADASCWFNLGITYEGLGRADEAAAAHATAYRLAPGSEEYRRAHTRWEAHRKARAGYDAHVSGDLSAAERLYREALELNPANVTVWTNLAGLYRTRGSEKESREARRRAAELGSADDPEDKGGREKETGSATTPDGRAPEAAGETRDCLE